MVVYQYVWTSIHKCLFIVFLSFCLFVVSLSLLSVCLSVSISVCLSICLSGLQLRLWRSMIFFFMAAISGPLFNSARNTGIYSAAIVFLVIGTFLHISVSFFRLGVFSQELYYFNLKLMKLTYEMEKNLSNPQNSQLYIH